MDCQPHCKGRKSVFCFSQPSCFASDTIEYKARWFTEPVWTLWVEKSLLLLPGFTSVSQLSTLHSSHYSYDTISAARCQWIINCVANRNNVCFWIAKKLYFHYYRQRFNAACTHAVFRSYVPLLKKSWIPLHWHVVHAGVGLIWKPCSQLKFSYRLMLMTSYKWLRVLIDKPL